MKNLWHNQDGFSLVEALVAVAILAIVSAPILGAFLVARAAQAESTGRVTAQSLARYVLEQTQQQAFDNYDSVPTGTVTNTTAKPGYTLTRVVACAQTYDDPADSDPAFCVLKTVDVTVEWTGAKQRQLSHRIATSLERRK